jgi:hypothetical protein
MATVEPTRSPYRTAVRWGLLLAGVLTAGMRVPELHRFYSQWRALAGVDASAAEAYRTYFLVELGITVFVLAMGAGLFWVLGLRRKKAE